MLYDLEMSSKEQNLIKQAKRMGQPIPERIKNKPILKTGLILYYDAYFDLDNDRNESNRIPWTVITQYVDRYQFSEIQEEQFIYFARSLDDCYVKWLDKKRGNKNGRPC